MSQLDSGTFQQVKDLVLSGYHLNDIQGWLARQHYYLPEQVLKASNALLWSVSASAAP